MDTATETIERRKHKRFEVEKGAFAALHPSFTVLGQISNVSKGGLAFCYVSSRERTGRSSALNVLLTDGTFRLLAVPSTQAWDSSGPTNYSLGLITLRHCGMKFRSLTDEQKSDLEYFIDSFTQPLEEA